MKIIFYLILSTTGMALIKYGGADFYLSNSRLNFSTGPLFISGVLCYITSFILWLIILKQQDLSYVFPITSSLGIVIASGLGFAMGEDITSSKVAGTILIIIGVIIISRHNI